MKKTIYLLLFLISLHHSPSYTAAQIIPPIPKKASSENQISIVILSDKDKEINIHTLLKDFPDLKLRYIYKHVFEGFSVEGSTASLEKLARKHRNEINTISPVHMYKAQKEDNMQIIGGEKVRGFFDNQNRRLTGEGVVVGVIDTGIDYTHPDLRRSYKGGYDFVDRDMDPMETKTKYAQNTLHGTHVAGIIAANGKINGVAPNAKVIAYRALGPGGEGTTEQVLAAIDEAIKDKVDILNLSLGNDINGPDLPISLSINKAVEKGIVAVTSSGNSGPNIWTVGSPGTAAKAISVGASTPTMEIPCLFVEELNREIRLEPMQGAVDWQLDRAYKLAFGGLGKKEDLSQVNGKIALIQRGEITFTEKVNNAKKAGAVAAIIYNNTVGSFVGNMEIETIPAATISKADGQQLKSLLEKGYVSTKTIIKIEKDFLAPFSSRGPVTTTWGIKPDIVAPGVAIKSTIPGGYLVLQGTSMAAPHIAGACALIKQAHPEWDPDKIKAVLMNTALLLKNEKGETYHTYEQGAGRLRIDEAINTKTIVTPASLQFGRFKLSDQQHEHKQYITIENISKNKQRYSFQIPKNEHGVEWKIPLTFTLNPNEKKKVALAMVVDPLAFKKKMHDGYIELQAGSQKINLPYLYVLEEPEYPRVMGFDFGIGDEKNTYRYEVYLPGGADEFGIALFDPDSQQFAGFLDTKTEVERGLLKQELSSSNLPFNGLYIAKVFAKKAGKEDMIEENIIIFGSEKRENRLKK